MKTKTTQGNTLTYHQKDHIYDSGHVTISNSGGDIRAIVYNDQGAVKIETREPYCVSLILVAEAVEFLNECHEAERKEQSTFKTEVEFTFATDKDKVKVLCNGMFFDDLGQTHGGQYSKVVPGLAEAAHKWAGWTQ